MELFEIVSIIKDVILALVAILGIIIASKMYFTITPRMQISVLEIQRTSNGIILRIEIKNTSKVKVVPHLCRLQILRYDVTKISNLSEFVPFSKNRIIVGEEPKVWNEPLEIITTTTHIYPSDTITVDRYVDFKKDELLHVGVQFQAKINIVLQLIYSIKKVENWTSTFIFLR